MRPAPVFLAAALAACQPAEPPSAQESGSQASPGQSVGQSAATPKPITDRRGTIPPRITGEYRVAGIDGRPLDAPFGIAVSIGGERIALASRCPGFAWSYTYQAGTIVLQDDPGGGLAREAGTGTDCRSGFPSEYRDLARAFAAATSVRRPPANALEFTGGGHSVTLFSQ